MFRQPSLFANDTFLEYRGYMGVGVIRGEEVTVQSDIVEAVFGDKTFGY